MTKAANTDRLRELLRKYSQQGPTAFSLRRYVEEELRRVMPAALDALDVAHALVDEMPSGDPPPFVDALRQALRRFESL